jgi:hypothetical protein
MGTKQLQFSAVDSTVCWATPVNDTTSHGACVRTTDGGKTWALSVVPGQHGFFASSISAVDAVRAWIVFDSYTAVGGVYATTDGGTTWAKQTTAFRSPDSFVDFVKFFDDRHGLAVGDPNDGYWEIYTTTDGGNQWTRVPSTNIPPPFPGEFAYWGGVTASHGDRFWFPSNHQSLYRTTDRGLTWSAARDAYPGAIGMGVAFKDSLHGLLSGDAPGNIGFRRTTDGGVTFSQVGTPTHLTASYVTYVPGTRGAYVASSYDLWEWAPGSGYSPDDGATWIPIDSLNHGRSVFLSPTFGWSAGEEDFLYRWTGDLQNAHASYLEAIPDSLDFENVRPGTESGSLETVIQNGPATKYITSLHLDRTEFLLQPAPTLPLLLPPFSKTTFSLIFRPTTPEIVVRDSMVVTTSDPSSARVAIALQGRGSGAVRSTNPGTLYGISEHSGRVGLYEIDRLSGVARPVSRFSPRPPPGVSAFTVRGSDNTLYAAFRSGLKTSLYRLSTEHGDLEYAGEIPVDSIQAMSFDRSDRLFMCTAAGQLGAMRLGGGEFRSVGPIGHRCTGLVFSPATGMLWASAHDTVFTVDTTTGLATTVGTSSWDAPRSSIAFSSLGVLYGMFGRWLVIIDKVRGTATEVGPTGTTDLSAIAMSDALTGADHQSQPGPLVWGLEQNFPNPFNPRTVVSYQLPVGSDVKLVVFDMLGREVAILVDGKADAGAHQVTFDGGGLSSGVYICRLTAGTFTVSRKMLLAK